VATDEHRAPRREAHWEATLFGLVAAALLIGLAARQRAGMMQRLGAVLC
jgi:hypothetical protein